ncbi:helix-turn-helix domain-containing protein [Pseudooceanicola sp. CBS1P-1]|uniref:Helix-turn-helix domain-containing protein n=1 Tax=Pseudooceanicola albus TaxID=2692189 RepID=A0A6L7G101_9RHOB|nr:MULTISPECIES: helix-turn-helix domain-containing protein [Pseudooceanicola]MBT9382651.1 helix-turn-helix domain-containing protein [Pseudooceanicola endophyticus]MXN17190.1 helix-turn-helix domain-containing protein [Pseudooceanicola albus]
MKNGSNNVARATRIMLALGSAGRDGMSLSALAEVIGDAKPSIHRALISMGESGFVTQKVRRGNYFLGPAVYALAHRTPSVTELVGIVRPKMLSVTAETGYSTFLMMRAGLDSICIDMQPGRTMAATMIDGIGGRVPLGLTIGGIALLGQLDQPTREQILRANSGQTAAAGLIPAQIQREIETYHMNGYACGRRQGPHFAHVCIALPVLDLALPGCEAAISVVAPDMAMADTDIHVHARRIRSALRESLASQAVV